MCNDISTKRCSAHFFLTTAVLKRTSGFHRFRYLSSSLRSSSLHVRYLHTEFATYFILPQ